MNARMDRIKDMFTIVLGGRLSVEGRDRTFARLPLWLAALAALSSPQLLIVTALLIIAFGMKVSVDKA